MTAAIVGLIAVLWLASLALPVWRANGQTTTGHDLLLTGCLGVLAGQLQWFGNPLILLTCWVALRDADNVLVTLPLALVLAGVLIATVLKRQVMDNEAGLSFAIERRYAGYYAWVAAVALSAGLNVILALHSLGAAPA